MNGESSERSQRHNVRGESMKEIMNVESKTLGVSIL
jgi:hypothetical protein